MHSTEANYTVIKGEMNVVRVRVVIVQLIKKKKRCVILMFLKKCIIVLLLLHVFVALIDCWYCLLF